MTHEELIKEIEQLPVEERIAVRDAIEESIYKVAELPKSRDLKVERLSGVMKPVAVTHSPNAGNGQSSLSEKLYGILQFETGPPTDEEVKDMIADYLLKKYY